MAQSIDPSSLVMRRSTYQPPTPTINVSVGSDASPGTHRILRRVERRVDISSGAAGSERGVTEQRGESAPDNEILDGWGKRSGG